MVSIGTSTVKAENMASYQIDVQPSVLIWARESIGLTREQAAEKLHMSDIDLHYLEEGVGNVSTAKLREMAKVYDRPFLAFFLQEPPPDEDALPDFRVKPTNLGRPWSFDLHRAYRRVAGQREIALDLARLAEEPPPAIDLRLSLNDDPESAGSRVRRWLAPVDLALPLDAYEVFNRWAAAVEAKGVLVTQVSGIEITEMRGFSIGEEAFPTIALNVRDYIRARTFSLLHELTHVLLRSAALCDLGEATNRVSAAVALTERFCDATAAAALMPSSLFSAEDAARRIAAAATWSASDLTLLADRFGVSKEASFLRLVDLGYLRRQDYLAWKRQSPEHGGADAGQSSGGNYYRNQVRRLGRRYVAMVVDALDRGDISPLAAADCLDMKLPNVSRLAEYIASES